jgi:hypothetical protein
LVVPGLHDGPFLRSFLLPFPLLLSDDNPPKFSIRLTRYYARVYSYSLQGNNLLFLFGLGVPCDDSLCLFKLDKYSVLDLMASIGNSN